MGNLVRSLLSGVASASPVDPSPSVIPFYCRIQKYTSMSILSRALNDDQDVCSATGEMPEEVDFFW